MFHSRGVSSHSYVFNLFQRFVILKAIIYKPGDSWVEVEIDSYHVNWKVKFKRQLKYWILLKHQCILSSEYWVYVSLYSLMKILQICWAWECKLVSLPNLTKMSMSNYICQRSTMATTMLSIFHNTALKLLRLYVPLFLINSIFHQMIWNVSWM